MKTTNNVQKAAIKLTAVIASIVLIGLNVNAQGLFRGYIYNDKYEETGFAYLVKPNSMGEVNTGFNMSSEFFMVETENELELEEWMLDEVSFNFMLMYSTAEAEESLEVEEWMLNEKCFGIQEIESTASYEKEIETELELENWMLADNVWELH